MLMRRGILIVLFALAGLSAVAQIDKKDENLSWRAKLEKADRLMAAGSYYNAIDYYEAVIKEQSDDGNLIMRVGHVFYAARNYDKAEEYYKKAFELDKDKYRLAQYYYAQMLKIHGKYEEAKVNFKEFRMNNRGNTDEDRELERLARRDEKGCDMALAMLANGQQGRVKTLVEHMSNTINGQYSDYSPRYLGRDSAIIFGSIRVDSVPVINDPKDDTVPKGRFYTAIRAGEDWTTPHMLDAPFNDPEMHTGNGSFSLDGQRFYLTKCEELEGAVVRCDIYMIEKDENGDWGEAVKLPFNDPKANTKHPTEVPYRDGQVMLLFSSDREGGAGGYDLWYAMEDRNGEFGEAKRIFGRMNTYRDEITPYYDPKEDALFFSSNGLDNVGGFDIFRADRKGSRSWKTPVNLGMPLNSSYDDFYYYQQAKGNEALLVSNRSGALSPKWPHCCDDIWYIKKVKNPVFTIMGKVYAKGDSTKTPIEGASVELFYAETNAKTDSAVSTADIGFEFFRGTEYQNYRLEARKQGYTYGVNTTSTIGLTDDDTIYVDLYLTPIEQVGTIVLRNVYFDLDKAFIREDAKPSLDTVYNILIKNPNIKIELSSHTDSRAPDDYNLKLSQRRADSSKAYLVKKGIDPERIVAIGYGETRLLNDCDDGVPCTEIEHQINRRTEFKIIGEVKGAIITYDQTEIEAVRKKKREGTLKGDEKIWEVDGGEEETPRDKNK